MAHAEFILAVIRHTPTWVWPLLLALLWLGGWQTLPRTASLRRTTLLPAAMLMLSSWGVVSAFGFGTALLAWGLGGVAAAVPALRAGVPGARFSPAAQSFTLPGSWVPLALMLAIFCMKFGVGMSLALHPEWRDGVGLSFGASLAYGGFSGVFAGRALALARLARETPHGIAA